MLISFILDSPCFPIKLSLPIYPQRHILSVLLFSNHGDYEKVSFLILTNLFRIFFVSIYSNSIISCIVKYRTTLTCCCPIFFTLYLSYTKTKLSLLLIIKDSPLWFIVCVINTYFHIHVPFFIYQKQKLYSFDDLLFVVL